MLGTEECLEGLMAEWTPLQSPPPPSCCSEFLKVKLQMSFVVSLLCLDEVL